MLRSRLPTAALLLFFAAPAAAQDTPDVEPAVVEAPAPTPVSYTLDPKAGSVYVLVYKDPDTLGAALSHDHVVRSTGWSGSVSWTDGTPEDCNVDVTVPVSGLTPDEPAWRKKLGLEGELSEGDRETVRDNFRSEDQLYMANHKNITFKSTSCTDAGGGKFKVTGALTVRGKSKNVTVPMKITADGASFSASGTFKANATDFGFEPFSAMFGQLKNKNEMKWVLDMRGSAG